MCYLKRLYPSLFAVLAGIFLLSSCDKGPPPEDNMEHAVTPEVSAPGTPAVTEEHSPVLDEEPSAEETRSADSLKLSIMDDPYEETDEDWLGKSGRTDDPPETDNLLPDLFGEKERDKSGTVKMDMLLDDDQQEMSGIVDGAGMSIKYKTD